MIKVMGSYFVLIHFPGGPLIMRDETRDPVDPPISLFRTLEEAERTASKNQAARAYGAEAFVVGEGFDLDTRK